MAEGASQRPLLVDQDPHGDILDPHGDILDPLELEGVDAEMEDSFQLEVKGMDNESLQTKCSSLKDSSKK